ncbi:hypothetical protein D9M71_367630 [compost metagenome]
MQPLAAAVGGGPEPGLVHLDPLARREPGHAVHLAAHHLARMGAFVGAEPVFQAVVDPAVEGPEHRVHMGGEGISQVVVLRAEPARREVHRVAVEDHRRAIGRITGDRRPAHVQPVVHAQFQLRAEFAELQLRQVFRVLVLRLPHLEVGVEGLVALDVQQPLVEFLVLRRFPGRRHRVAVLVHRLRGEVLQAVADVLARQRQAGPGRQRLQPARGHQHVPVHEQEVLSGTVAILVPATRITLLATRPGLPAQATQGGLLVLFQLVPLVPRCVP